MQDAKSGEHDVSLGPEACLSLQFFEAFAVGCRRIHGDAEQLFHVAWCYHVTSGVGDSRKEVGKVG